MSNNTALRTGNTVHNENNFEIERSKVEFRSCGATLRGLLLTPTGTKEALPTIVMAPGMSGVKEGSIMKYADYFARGGFAVLAYDNINFGESDGEPRQEVDPALQRRGYRDAITYAGSRPEVDKIRIGIFGTSYSGGHVLEVGAHDRRVKCVVSQIPAISGFKAFQRLPRTVQAAVLKAQDEDREQRYLGKPPKTLKAVSDDPDRALRDGWPGGVRVFHGAAENSAKLEERTDAPLDGPLPQRGELCFHALDFSHPSADDCCAG
jgi:cephalosporin-C deacetylase-like acetyl esterase